MEFSDASFHHGGKINCCVRRMGGSQFCFFYHEWSPQAQHTSVRVPVYSQPPIAPRMATWMIPGKFVPDGDLTRTSQVSDTRKLPFSPSSPPMHISRTTTATALHLIFAVGQHRRSLSASSINPPLFSCLASRYRLSLSFVFLYPSLVIIRRRPSPAHPVALALPVHVGLIVLHAIVLAGKPGPTLWPWTHVLALASMRAVMASQVAQRGERPATRLACMFALWSRHGGLQLGQFGVSRHVKVCRRRRSRKLVCGWQLDRHLAHWDRSRSRRTGHGLRLERHWGRWCIPRHLWMQHPFGTGAEHVLVVLGHVKGVLRRIWQVLQLWGERRPVGDRQHQLAERR